MYAMYLYIFSILFLLAFGTWDNNDNNILYYYDGVEVGNRHARWCRITRYMMQCVAHRPYIGVRYITLICVFCGHEYVGSWLFMILLSSLNS